MFKRFKYRLVATLQWTIYWEDADLTESGHWLMYENGFGQRKFKLTDKALFTQESGHPGYIELVLWKQTGILPRGCEKSWAVKQ